MDVSFTVTVIKEELNEEPDGSSIPGVGTKLEPDPDCEDVELKPDPGDQETRSKLADLFSIYEGHVMKQDLVIGPVDLQETGPTEKQIDKELAVQEDGPEEEGRRKEIEANPQAGRTKNPSAPSHEQPSSSIVYACDICQKHCKLKKDLIHHMRRHRQIKKCCCELCGKKFGSHTKKMLCKRCTGPRKTHLNFTCDVCNKIFQKKLALIYHLRLHSGERPYSCEICEKTFTSIHNLNNHLSVHKKKKPKKLACNLCDRKFQFQSRLRQHKFIMHSAEKPFACTMCDMKFKMERSLTHHLRLHTDDRPFSCDICKHTFTTKAGVMNHVQIHSGVKLAKKLSCEFCNQKFAYKSRLRYHQSAIHAREKIYSCNSCNEAFIYKSSLIKHFRKHTGATPFTCNICGKSYSSSGGLKKHVAMVHFPMKTQECEVCKKGFKTAGALKEHLDIHASQKLYECDVCKRKFSQKRTLQVHKMVHTSERPFTCDICNRSFRLKHNIVNHIRNHLNTEKKYPCQFCEKKFKSTQLLKSHLSTHVMREFVCDFCGEVFRIKLHLRTHIEVHFYEQQIANSVPKEKKMVQKPDPVFEGLDLKIKKEPIDKEAAIDELYALLYADHVKAEVVEAAEELQEPVADTKPVHKVQSTPHRCKLCDKHFYTAFALSEHARAHAPGAEAEFACDVCGRQYACARTLATHVKVHGDGDASKETKYRYPWCCRACGRRFRFKCRLLEHQQSSKKCSTKESLTRRSYACEVCGKVLYSRTGYLSHLRGHGCANNKTCVVCGEVLSTYKEYLIHLRAHDYENIKKFECRVFLTRCDDKTSLTQHIGNSYTCGECGKVLMTKKGYLSHLRAHDCENIKKFECRVFLTRCNSKTSLTQHIGNSYTCGECGKVLMTKKGYLSHLRAHDCENTKKFDCRVFLTRCDSKTSLTQHIECSYTCGECGKVLMTKKGYLSHLRAHGVMRLWVCNVCGEKCKSQVDLLSHRRLHNEEEMMCKICNNFFKNGSALVDHLREHTFENHK